MMEIVRVILIVLLCLVAVIVLLIGLVVLLNAPANVKAMNRSVQVFCDTLDQFFPLTEVDCGKYRHLTLFGIMKFKVKQYTAEGAGNLSVMTVNVGLMQMASVVLTPWKRDLPLVSMDYMYMLGNRTAYLEFYDLVLSKDETYGALMDQLRSILAEYDHLESTAASAAWYDSLKTVCFYKKGKKKDDASLIDMMEKGVRAVMTYGLALPELEETAISEKAGLQKNYSDGLIENGGISTDIFVKALGTDETRDYFDSVMFKNANS